MDFDPGPVFELRDYEVLPGHLDDWLSPEPSSFLASGRISRVARIRTASGDASA